MRKIMNLWACAVALAAIGLLSSVPALAAVAVDQGAQIQLGEGCEKKCPKDKDSGDQGNQNWTADNDAQALCGGSCDKSKDKDAEDKGDQSWTADNGAQALCGGTCDKSKDKDAEDKGDQSWTADNGAQALCGGTCDKSKKDKGEGDSGSES